MILVDGRETGKSIDNYHNLEELLLGVLDGGLLEGRVVTDVSVNDEAFSEIYPHQAEDIEASEITKVEITTMPVAEMAANIVEELGKVISLLDHGAREVAEKFRRADDAEALEMFQDLLDVIRDFMNMLGVLRGELSLKDNVVFNAAAEDISSLFSEMLDVVGNEDWILLADLLEYEFIPSVGRWKKVIIDLRETIGEIRKA